MIKPRKEEVDYKDLEELKFYYMFISSCLFEEEKNKLKDSWNKQCKTNNIPWWRFVMENTKIELDIKP